MPDKNQLRIVFFGTPAFAEYALRAVHNRAYRIIAVVTAPDKPAGRGYQLQESAVKKAAVELGIPVLQPAKLKDPVFIEELRALKADIQIVIAFRMLPEVVWNMPPLGTFNLHASLLPAYRGAAPINRAIMNGETETGVSTFFLKHEIDTGSILLQQKTGIGPEEDAGSLHDRLMHMGAELVCDSLELICRGGYTLKPQPDGAYPHAPKIFTEDCRICWDRSATEIHNQIRGLAPYPAAFTEMNGKKLKVFRSQISSEPAVTCGKIEIRGKDTIAAHCSDFVLFLQEVQPEGKKRMSSKELINGLHPA